MSRTHTIPAALAPQWLELPFLETRIRAGLSGFPSPAQDYEGRRLDLNERLIKRPAATLFLTVPGDNMEPLGIDDGDLLVVDRSIRIPATYSPP